MYQPAQVPGEINLILAQLAPGDVDRVQTTYQFAAAAHAGQVRDEGSPFIEHPVQVVVILWNELGNRKVDVVLAALCHDVLEDCPDIDPAVLGDLIGQNALELVLAVTKRGVADHLKAARDSEYLDSIRHASHDVRLLKLADRIHNLRSIPAAGDRAKARRYLNVSRDAFLPIAAATDITAERLVADACDAIESYLEAFDATQRQ